MPLLPDLPNEMLEQIMKYLLPDDVDNFSDSREEFRAIASRILPRHNELKRKNSQVSCGLVGSVGYKALHPIFLLRDILQDPEILWYVKTMFVELCDDHYAYRNEETWDEARRIAVDCKDGIIKMVQACPYLDQEERKNWINATLSCHQDTAVALLACMFPCLETIRLTGIHSNNELHSLARKIAQANRLDPGGSHALSKLNLVEEEGCEAEIFQKMPAFEPLSGLPSMRRYTGRYLYHENEWTTPKEKSTITSVELYQCMIYIAALRSVFGGIANLRDFTYEHHWAFEIPGKEMQRVEETLGEKGEAEDSDEDSEVGGIVKPFMGSLRGFQVLKNIRVQNEAFVEEDLEGSAGGRTVHRLVDLLPASVVNVTLAMPQLSGKESYRLMEGLPGLKWERVPKLEKVIVGSDCPYKEMKTVFETVGIELVS
ncbi:hypothetical protein HO173_010411 [Letharia columbiana]|uniref:F-box domain-containing protein n=1 Tax=Letharia columbiana TaxID=112416 RepID=A0A8H6L0X6_9LECA|nr:uncharacterized protein HO173_010411 [Letharia columbiana]KAF6231450.1 hypothetical protein HO173_010411 [Letharia columbiana]